MSSTDETSILAAEAAAALTLFKQRLQDKCPENFYITFYEITQGGVVYGDRVPKFFAQCFDYNTETDNFDDKLNAMVTTFFEHILLKTGYGYIDETSGLVCIDYKKLEHSRCLKGVDNITVSCDMVDVNGVAVRRYIFSGII